MAKLKLDKETRDTISDQEKIKKLTEHEGWPLVRALILKRAAELINISDINVLNPVSGNLIAEIGMRQLASARLIEVLREVQGTAEQFDANAALTQGVESEYVLRR